jgi:lipopolysaccharide export system protein LptC
VTAAQARSDRLPRGKARAHSRLVLFLRVALPAVMLAMIAVLAGLVVSHAMRRHAAARQDESTPIRMTNPHFFGRDNQGRAFMLSAREAARDERSFQVVLLQYPALQLDVGGAHPSTLNADSGVYHEDTRILLLKGHVRADNAGASNFATDQAVVNTRTGVVSGPQSLTTQTAAGAAQSGSFDVYDKGDRVILKGGVRARLKSH